MDHFCRDSNLYEKNYRKCGLMMGAALLLMLVINDGIFEKPDLRARGPLTDLIRPIPLCSRFGKIFPSQRL